jgi:hypothetical protein
MILRSAQRGAIRLFAVHYYFCSSFTLLSNVLFSAAANIFGSFPVEQRYLLPEDEPLPLDCTPQKRYISFLLYLLLPSFYFLFLSVLICEIGGRFAFL